MTARRLTTTRKEKICYLLISMTDAMRYPGRENGRIAQLLLGNRAGLQGDKQTMQLSRLTVESKKLEWLSRNGGACCWLIIWCVIR